MSSYSTVEPAIPKTAIPKKTHNACLPTARSPPYPDTIAVEKAVANTWGFFRIETDHMEEVVKEGKRWLSCETSVCLCKNEVKSFVSK